MRAGRLRHRITIQRPEVTRSETGAEIITWVTVIDRFPAEVAPLRGREYFQSDVQRADMDTKIIVRWMPQIQAMTAKWRILHDGQIYNVYSQANADNRNIMVEIMAKTGVNKG